MALQGLERSIDWQARQNILKRNLNFLIILFPFVILFLESVIIMLIDLLNELRTLVSVEKRMLILCLLTSFCEQWGVPCIF